MAFLANLRSTIAYQPSGATVSTGAIYTAASSGAAWSNALVSSMVSIGTSTNQTYTTLSQGNFTSTSNWVTTLTGRTSTIGVSMSANAQTQLVVSQVSTVSSIQFTSTLGQTWSTLSNVTGLPSSLTTSYSAGAISGDGRYGLLAASGGYLYTTANSGASWTNTNPNTPIIYLPFETAPVNGASGGTILTVTGSPALVPGIVGKNAINLANTPGSNTPSTYIRGTYSLPLAFSVSLWFNVQSMNGTYQVIYSALNSVLELFINPSNQLVGQIPTGTGLNAYQVTSGILSVNTWYNVTLIYQVNGTSSMYLNNQFVGNFTTSTGFGTSQSTNAFGLGTYENQLNYAFNGYIDDFKIYASSPSIYLPFDTTPVNGAIGGTTLTVVGSPALVPGIVGTNAVNLVNTPAGNATQYIRGSWINGSLSNFTVSFWFNQQSTVSGQCYIFSAFNNTCSIQTSTASNILVVTIPTTASPYFLALTVPVAQTIALNTWYNVTLIYQSAGMCYAYLNNALYGSVAGAGIFGLASSNLFGLSGFDNGTSNAFNGYIDDLKIYNSAISTTPFSPMVPQNWSNIALSNSGQYMLATATGSGLFLSSNYGSTWTQVTSAMLYAAWTAAQVSATGQYMLANSPVVNVQPQLTGLTGDTTTATVVQTTWVQNGISWTSNASNTIFAAGFQPWVAFNNVGNSSVTPYSWASLSIYPTPTSITNISSPGPGNYTGEWLQIYSSIPLVMYSYNFACGGLNLNFPKEYFIVGSRDNSTWFPIQSVTLSSNPFTTNFVVATSPAIIVNSSTSQTINGGAAVSFIPTIYTTTTNPYNYFRIIAKTNFGGANFELNEWYINFQAGGQTYSTNYGSTWNNGYSIPSNVLALSPSGQTALSAPLITPQQTGLRGDSTSATVIPTTWQQNGITWTSLASSVFGSAWQPWIAFNNVVPLTTAGGFYSWASSANYNAGTGTFNFPTVTTNTVIQSPAAQTYYGDWLQMYSNVPLVLYSYNLGANNAASTNIPKTYFIVGSTDNSNWYPIQRVSIDTHPFAIASTGIPTSPPIIVNQSGTQTMTSSGGSSGILTCTTYTTTTNAYNYFRIIANTLFGGTSFELSEWFVNFQNANGGTTYNVVPSLQAFSTGTSTSGTIPGVITGSAVSNTGQYMVVITNATTGNNVYYSTNTGATFTGLQLGSLAMTSCAISYDGSYITVSNATTVYQLNNNSTGYTVAVGNQAGLQNQAQNAIAIGNYAGTINQTANSIILNASGQGLNSVAQGFYVAPIAQYTASSSSTFSLLGYGSDNQVVQTGITLGNASATQPIYGEWIQIQLTTATSITSYVLQPRIILPSRYPVAWNLVGSTDGINWTILDYQQAQTIALWGTSFVLSKASPVYSYFRIIFTQINSANGYADIGGIILSNANGSLFGAYATYTTVLSGNYSLLQLNSTIVCIVSVSWFPTPLNVISDGFGGTAAYIVTPNGYIQNVYTGFQSFVNVGYNSSYIAIQGTNTSVLVNALSVHSLSANSLSANSLLANSVSANSVSANLLSANSLSVNGYNYSKAMYIVSLPQYGSFTNYTNSSQGNFPGSLWNTLNMITYSVYGGVNLISSFTQPSFQLPYVGMWQFQITATVSRSIPNPVYLLFNGSTFYTGNPTKTIIGTGPTYSLSTSIIWVFNPTAGLSYQFGIYPGDDTISTTYSNLTFICTYMS